MDRKPNNTSPYVYSLHLLLITTVFTISVLDFHVYGGPYQSEHTVGRDTKCTSPYVDDARLFLISCGVRDLSARLS